MFDKGKFHQILMGQRGEEVPHTVTDNCSALRYDVAEGVAYLHSRLNATTGRTIEAASFVYALIEILAEKGVLSIHEIDTRKKGVAERILKRFMKYDPGVVLQEPEQDKYALKKTVRIDCEDRIHLCKAICCKMVFPLSRQDIEEGVIRWDLGKPYVIAKKADGYCHHLDRKGLGCTVHTQRPIPCRAYDCRKDSRIWLDFEKKVIHPKINDPDWPHNLTPQEMSFGLAL